MKKQILFLTLFVAAILVGNNAFGQLDARTTPAAIDPLSCVGTSLPLHPYPGQTYTYTMDGSTGAQAADQWTWFATKNPEFIDAATNTLQIADMLTTASGALLNVGASYGVTSGTNSVDITWSPELIAATLYQGDATGWATADASNPTPTFVVGYATGVNCTDNIQVYEINPELNFTLDIANIDAAGTTLAWETPTEQCVDVVRSAVYNSTSNELDMDYGTNTLYFEVVAANFVQDWTPTFHLVSGLVGAQTAVVTLHASQADAQADANVLGTANWTAATVGTDWATGTAFTANNASDVVDGVSLFVKVVISNNTEESLTDNAFVLAVDAIDNAGAGQWDMEDDDCTTPTDAADQVDQATHTVTPRPTIIMDGAAMSEPSGTAPEDLIIKTP
ncbi:hypothetical protein [uncultured Draconibacterium sp.]|uniref:hypothetical protein n=1 Tax=uncultured Draconibacterium sp. TaxID=1573823 RepID=UPI002AA80C9F|nr:hypothetical protein [uncultured Draconibacterium sp.]